LATSTLTLLSLLVEVVGIIAMACLSGTLYYIVIYGEAGDTSTFLNLGILTAGIFAIPNLIRGEYKITAFLEFEPHLHRAFFAWNVTFVVLLAIGFLAKMTIVYSRGWTLAFYLSTIPVLLLLRYFIVRTAAAANSAGLVAARRVFLIGAGNEIGAFIIRYQPRSLGICVAGCRFLTPLRRDVSADERLEALDLDLQEAVNSARVLEPDTIIPGCPVVGHCAYKQVRRAIHISACRNSSGA